MADFTYEDWADWLGESLLTTKNADRPLFLFVDETILADMIESTDPEATVAALVSAVRREMASGAGDLFAKIRTRGAVWFAKPGPAPRPPCMPFLAVTVLAATRMATEGEVASNNYYVRLRDLLGLPGEGMPKGFDRASKALWGGMRDWLDETTQGAFGRSTIWTQKYLPYVGPPISQALWRRADQARLYDFFHEKGYVPGEVSDGDALFAAFTKWANAHGGFSSGVYAMLKNPDLRAHLRSIVVNEALGWGGGTVTRVKSVALRLLARRDELGRDVVDFVAERASSIPVDVTVKAPGGTVVRATLVEDWCILGRRASRQDLEGGLELEAGPTRMVLSPQHLHILVPQTRLGAWVSVMFPPRASEVRLLVRDEMCGPVEEYLRVAAGPGWTARQVAQLEGWTIFDGVRLDTGRGSPTDLRLGRLGPPPGGLAKLKGGLTLDSNRTYLRGGEPDVVLDAAAENISLPVFVDGDLIGEVARAAAFPLRQHDFQLGPHEVHVGASILRFSSTDRATEPGDVDDEPDQGAVGECTLRGADLRCADDAGPGARPLVLDRGFHHIIIGSRVGDVQVVAGWSRPKWMSNVGLQTNRYPMWPAFPVAWVGSKGKYMRRIVRVQGAPAGSPVRGDRSPRDVEWARLVLRADSWLARADRPGPDGWTEYVAAARGILGDA